MIKMFSSKLFLLLLICLSSSINFGLCLSEHDLNKYNNGNRAILPIGDEKYEFIKLTTPIHLYSESYDHVYVNTNGLLSFRTEFVNYMNVPFPLENPAIAAFYANVDTSESNETTTIEYNEIVDDRELLLSASELISDNYVEAHDFEAKALFVATWRNVGHYNHNNDRQNTFQVVVICGDEETYVRFLYPQNGINWIQGDMGESGLPDVRAQAGFVSEDGRYFTLKGSGTENIRYLSDASNHGVAGSYLFRIGLVGSNGVIEEPDSSSYFTEENIPLTCAAGGRLKCHTRASCFDKSTGYCCKCNHGYYGNGLSCILNNNPLRVAGVLKGKVGREDIDGTIQSYVVVNDGRSYTAVTPIPDSISYSSQLLSVVGETIGWLFAKPLENAINGYDLTGGKLVRTSIIVFPTGERLDVVQNFTGLNLYDQLDVDVNIQGNLPKLPDRTTVSMKQIQTEYSLNSPNEIHHSTDRHLELGNGETMHFTIDDTIKFESCVHAFPDLAAIGSVTGKATKISLVYMPDEKALRIGMLNRIGDKTNLSPCSAYGQNSCGPNSLCVPDEEDLHDDDAYACICHHGFEPAPRTDEGLEYCVDIDECYGENACNVNAICINMPGGYNCRCRPGFVGNGYTCESDKAQNSNEGEKPDDRQQPSSVQYENEQTPEHGHENTEEHNQEQDHDHNEEHEQERNPQHNQQPNYEQPTSTHPDKQHQDGRESHYGYGQEHHQHGYGEQEQQEQEREREHDDRESHPGYGQENNQHGYDEQEQQERERERDHDGREIHSGYGQENSQHGYGEQEQGRERERDHDDRESHPGYGEEHNQHGYGEQEQGRERERDHDDRESHPGYGQDNNQHGYSEQEQQEHERNRDHVSENNHQTTQEHSEHNDHNTEHESHVPERGNEQEEVKQPTYTSGVNVHNVNINNVYYPQLPDTRFDPADEYENCRRCSDFADCIDGECKCRDGWHGNGEECDYNCQNSHEEWDGEKCVPVYNEELDDEEVPPFCTNIGCTCPTGYQLIEFAIGHTCRILRNYETSTDETSCSIENTCDRNAECAYVDSRYTCICNEGYDGDGYNCVEKEKSCLYDNICHEHATCVYDAAAAKSICKCSEKYEGDGFHCDLARECHTHDNCGFNSDCDDGICVCQTGFERDMQDNCVPIGLCGGVFCVENAVCLWDQQHAVSYCNCPEGFIGDGTTSCKSIPPQCNIRNNCGLNAHCVQNYRNPSIFECVCQSGFYGDGFICTPEENCINIPSLCDHNARCHSTVSGLQCVCNEGFLGNGTYCAEIPKLDSGFLLISQGVAIVKVPYNGKRGQPLTVAQMAIGIDKDCATGRFYWSDITTRSIWSAKYDGTDKKPFIAEDLHSPEGITIDWISRRIYWTDSSKDTIEVADIDNSTRRAVIINKHLVNPRGIAVDPVQSKLYWSDWNRDAPKIEWANLDGTDRHVLLTSPHIQLPNSLAVKHQTGELCFADAGTKKIECIYAPTLDIRTIASNLSYPFGLAVSEDHFYWTDWQTKKIESVDHYGTRKAGLTGPLFGSHKMYGMTATTEKCAIYHTQCLNNGECPPNRICLNNHYAPSGRSCKCISSSKCNDYHAEYET